MIFETSVLMLAVVALVVGLIAADAMGGMKGGPVAGDHNLHVAPTQPTPDVDYIGPHVAVAATQYAPRDYLTGSSFLSSDD